MKTRERRERDVRCVRCRSSRFVRLSRPSPRASTTEECMNPIASIRRACMHACMHSRARMGRGRRCIHTVIPYILTRNTGVFDSYHTDHLFFTKNEKMNDRFVPRIETQYVHTPWSGPVVGHDTHTHILLYFTLYVYTVREVLHTIKKEHVLGTPACIACIRRRDVARETGDDRATTTPENERTRASPTRRDRESFTRESSVSGKSENPLAERDGKVNARGFIHSFIHSVRFGLT